MLKLRFCRVGRKNLPYYYIVAVDSRKPLKTRFVEKVGSYDCFLKKARIDSTLVIKLLQNGAQPSHTVLNLLKKEGIMKKFNAEKKPKKKTHVRPVPTSKARIEHIKKKHAAKLQRRKTRKFLLKKAVAERILKEKTDQEQKLKADK